MGSRPPAVDMSGGDSEAFASLLRDEGPAADYLSFGTFLRSGCADDARMLMRLQTHEMCEC